MKVNGRRGPGCRHLLLPLALLLAIGRPAKAASRDEAAPIAQTTAGRVRGYVDQGISSFKGIPYGGDTAQRRFQAPVPPDPWDGVRDALAFGPMAPQAGGRGGTDFFPTPPADSKMSEDCLTLNVWTPRLRDGGRRPVLVYFHGGGYTGWSANVDAYDGVNLCRRGDVVVVTVNHRLNGFGFLYLAELGGAKFADSGNAGLLDLVLALRWVHDNIAEFGGDPGCVTIFGQSGGGAKCATLMAMPAAHGLFHRVLTMSGQQLVGRTREHATETARHVLQALKLTPDRVDEILTLPTAQLMAAMRGAEWTPVLDGGALPRDPFTPDAPPLSADIPMVLGNTHDETRYFYGRGDASIFAVTWETLPAKLRELAGQYFMDVTPERAVAEYRRLYPDYTPTDVLFSATTAARSWRGMLIECERRAEQGGPTYAYNLTWSTPVEGGKWKAPHTLDIPLFFDNTAYTPGMTGSGAEARQLAALMSDSLIAFARTGNPGTPALPPWPRFNLAQRPTMLFDVPSRVADDPRGAERRLFAIGPYNQPGR